MSIRRDLVIKVSNGTATLDMPLQIYEKDHGIELRFKLMDYKYKYDKDPENILNSNKEDILEAYTTIVNPRGYELSQINGEVVDDTIKFMIEDSYTDELEELGIYQLQIHVKCTHSEFSIPPVRFEVLERLKGEKVVTDGDDEVDDSDIIDGSTKFVDDETGKLIIQWQKGDTISSVRLNAMVEVINNAVDEEAQRQLNELEREQQELERENRLQAALNSVDARVDESMNEYETRFNALTASQQQDAEVIDARDGETSLKARLDRDVRNPLQVYEDVEGSYIICDSTDGYAKNVEILGNTMQDADNLADIRSVGDKVEGQELYEIPVVSCGKNLFNKEKVIKGMYQNYDASTDDFTISQNNSSCVTEYIKVTPNKIYTKSNLGPGVYYDKYKTVIKNSLVLSNTFTVPSNAHYVVLNNDISANLDIVQLEEGTVATEYVPYQGHKLEILSPVQLEKVGDVADRIVCKDGVWGVEKNVKTVIYDGSEIWAESSADHSKKDILKFYTSADCVSTSYEVVGPIMSDRFTADSYNGTYYHNTEGISTTVDNDIGISILKSKLSTQDVTGFKKWLEANNVLVKYQTTNPQFIQLPHDQQVKLRTFAGKTNISFLTEIEGTIKAQVPKSIGATVNTHTEQINNLNKELDRVKKLEESTVSTVTTESDFTTVEETSNGYFEDVKLEGRTLVNLCKTVKVSSTFNRYDGILLPNTILLSNTKYTVLIKNNDTNSVSIYFNESLFEDGGRGIDILPGRPYIACKSTLTQSKLMDPIVRALSEDGTFYNLEAMLLEGDHTQNPPGYFEGLMSVGEDVEEISILSAKRDATLVIKEDFELGDIRFSDGTDLSSTTWRRTSYIQVEKSKTLYRNYKCTLFEYDQNKKFIRHDGESSSQPYLLSDSVKYIRTAYVISDVDNVIDNLYLGYSEDCKEITAKRDKKPLLYYNPTTDTWEKPILRQWDSIEKHSDGKYYYHKRSGEVVLNGSEDWRLSEFVIPNHVRVYSTFLWDFHKNYTYTINDKLPNETKDIKDRDVEGVYISNTLDIQIAKNKLSSQDEEGFRTWLKANPTTVVYQLAAEEVYECINIDLITYKDETNYIVNTGVIAPLSTLKVMCNINNVVRELQQKVSNLENYIQHVMIDALNNALNE